MANPVIQQIQTDNFLEHFGVKRRSGRYPYGSGERPHQHDSLRRIRKRVVNREKKLGDEANKSGYKTEVRGVRAQLKDDIRSGEGILSSLSRYQTDKAAIDYRYVSGKDFVRRQAKAAGKDFVDKLKKGQINELDAKHGKTYVDEMLHGSKKVERIDKFIKSQLSDEIADLKYELNNALSTAKDSKERKNIESQYKKVETEIRKFYEDVREEELGRLRHSSDSDFLEHYGIKRKSGRYRWGSGKRPFQGEVTRSVKAKASKFIKGKSSSQSSKSKEEPKKESKQITNDQMRANIERQKLINESLRLQKEFSSLTTKQKSDGRKWVEDILKTSGKALAVAFLIQQGNKYLKTNAQPPGSGGKKKR